MKTRTIITAIIAAASINSSAAQELLIDCKVWNCVQRMYNDQTGEYDRPYTITVVGDNVIGDVRCKRLEQVWHDDTATMFHFAALKRDARVYLVHDEGQTEFLNFGLSVGDIDGCTGRVVSVDEVAVNEISMFLVIYLYNGFLDSGKTTIQNHIFLDPVCGRITPLLVPLKEAREGKTGLFVFPASSKLCGIVSRRTSQYDPLLSPINIEIDNKLV